MLKWLPLYQTTALNHVVQHHQESVYRLIYKQPAGQASPLLQYHELPIAVWSTHSPVALAVMATQ